MTGAIACPCGTNARQIDQPHPPVRLISAPEPGDADDGDEYQFCSTCAFSACAGTGA